MKRKEVCGEEEGRAGRGRKDSRARGVDQNNCAQTAVFRCLVVAKQSEMKEEACGCTPLHCHTTNGSQ